MIAATAQSTTRQNGGHQRVLATINRERTLEITFLEAGGEAYVFTFG
jgi:hypothetical protein